MDRSNLKPWQFACWLLFLLAFTGCSSTAGYRIETADKVADSTAINPDEPIFSVFLIGDTGDASNKPRSTILQDLEKEIKKSGEQSAVIFLGDNIYPHGLPPENSRKRTKAEQTLMAQLNTVKGYAGRIIFIPGNHDWKSSGKSGLQWVRRQERFVETYLNRGNTFLPDSGYPGPVSVSFGKNPSFTGKNFGLRLIILDTQWWVHPHKKPLFEGLDMQEQKNKLVSDIEEKINSSGDSEVLVIGHHPMISYGRHGGKFPIYSHLLPPILGSMYVAYRKIWGYPQDVAGYSELRESLMQSFKGKEQLIYASGHEHSLQFIPTMQDSLEQYYLVSGSGSRSSYVKKRRDEAYTYRGKGYMVIRYFEDRLKKIEMRDTKGHVLFTKMIQPPG